MLRRRLPFSFTCSSDLSIDGHLSDERPVVVGTLFVVNFGSGSDLEGFAFAMIIGILTGTYSTVFVASPILMWLQSRESEDAGLSADGGLAELANQEAEADGAVPAASL